MTAQKQIKIKNAHEVELLARAGRILSAIIKELVRSLKSGMTTAQLDTMAEALIKANNVLPAFKGYRGFPACICASVNQEVVHGIPGTKVIHDGDIVSVDMGIIYEGYYSDTAVTVGVGNIGQELERLLGVTQEGLECGIAKAQVGNRLSDISFAIQSYVESSGFSVVRDFVGHGIGQNLHEEPEIPNFGPPHRGPILQEGMVLAIEPMVNMGTWQTKILDDGWTVETLDGKPSAHFEHTVAITAVGPQILTI
jgi:methionyl aminopeptidase